MRAYGTQPAVEVRVNGTGPYLFLIDTGANDVARIDTTLVEKLKIPHVGTTEATSATTNASVQARQIRVATLEVGSLRRDQVVALAGSYNFPGEYQPNIGGILAFDFFKDKLLTLDFCRREVRVTDGALPAPDGRSIVAYEERNGLPYLEVRIGGALRSALLDTGTDRALDLPTELLRTLFLAEAPRSLGSSVVGLGGEKKGIGVVRLADPVTIGTVPFARPVATFSEGWTVPVLGSALFRQAVLTFDQRARRVKIERPRGC